MRFLYLVCGLVIFVSCKNKSTENKDNIVFNDPALKSITDRINNKPENAALYFERANILHQMGKDSLALNDYKKAASFDSTKAEYFSTIGDLLFEHKDINGSVQWLQKAIKLNPEDPKAHLKIAKMFLYIAQYDNAFAEINVVMKHDPYNPEAYFLKGMIYKERKDTSKAISSFLTAIQVYPEYKPAIIQLGQLYTLQKNDIALKYYDNAFKLDTTDVFPLFAKGVYYQNIKDYAKAKEEYTNCIIHDHQYADAYFNMGWILIQEDSLEKAQRQYDLVTKIDPVNAGAYYNRGLCSELMNKKQDAISDYKQALVFNSKYQEAIDGLKRLGAK